MQSVQWNYRYITQTAEKDKNKNSHTLCQLKLSVTYFKLSDIAFQKGAPMNSCDFPC